MMSLWLIGAAFFALVGPLKVPASNRRGHHHSCASFQVFVNGHRGLLGLE
jgi:hypothetical protein